MYFDFITENVRGSRLKQSKSINNTLCLFFKESHLVVDISKNKMCRSDAFFFPSYAGEASAGILCSSLGQHILKPVDKSGPAVGA